MHVPSLIEKKRDGQTLTTKEIKSLVEDFTLGDLPDYQMSALAMAVFFRGMSPAETYHLTDAMMHSGRVLKYPEGSPPKIDKLSTGGVGDKVSIVLAPLLACDEAWVPMISGYGIGITGGTLDKLESILGFNASLDEKRALKQLEKIGVFMIGETDDICPADKKFHALRDMTGTVPSQPLIVASLMSKKLAENLDRLVVDVKFGSGAFMKTKKEAEQLAEAMTKVGAAMNVKTSYVLNPMDEPLGRSVGNALEIAECVEIFQGGGPREVVRLIVDLGEKISKTPRAQLEKCLKDGTAWKKFISLVYAQDGDATLVEKILDSHTAPIIQPFPAQSAGTVKRMDAELIGRASVILGAGRQRTSDPIDFAVGFSKIKKTGEKVEVDEPLFMIHARNERSIVNVTPLIDLSCTIRNFLIRCRLQDYIKFISSVALCKAWGFIPVPGH